MIRGNVLQIVERDEDRDDDLLLGVTRVLGVRDDQRPPAEEGLVERGDVIPVGA